MSFWDWALAAYDRPGVAEACLALQDDHGQQTAYLLWAAYAVPEGAALKAGAELARHWELTVLGPVRSARRALKPACPPVDDAARMALREDIKAAELRAERLLMETLEGLAAGPGPTDQRQQVLTLAAEAWGDRPPVQTLQTLVRALA